MEDKIDRILNLIRHLREDGMIANSLGGGNIAGTPEAGDALGEYPKNKKKKKREYNKYMTGGRGSRKLWLNYLKNK